MNTSDKTQGSTEHDRNQEAYRRLRVDIDKSFPKGWFVAVTEAGIIADAETFDEIDSKLDQLGDAAQSAVVVQAGDELPEYVEIISF